MPPCRGDEAAPCARWDRKADNLFQVAPDVRGDWWGQTQLPHAGNAPGTMSCPRGGLSGSSRLKEARAALTLACVGFLKWNSRRGLPQTRRDGSIRCGLAQHTSLQYMPRSLGWWGAQGVTENGPRLLPWRTLDSLHVKKTETAQVQRQRPGLGRKSKEVASESAGFRDREGVPW